jgi:hypothetical protein
MKEKATRLNSMESMTFQQQKIKKVNSVNLNIKMATAKGIRTPWMLFKSIPSHATEPYKLCFFNALVVMFDYSIRHCKKL